MLKAPIAAATDGNGAVRNGPATYAIIGDTPYGQPQIDNFPNDVAEINADPDVRLVMHLGDIKNGSSRCDILPADPHRFRRLRRSLGLHAGRQRVDRLPPHQQRRVHAD